MPNLGEEVEEATNHAQVPGAQGTAGCVTPLRVLHTACYTLTAVISSFRHSAMSLRHHPASLLLHVVWAHMASS